MDIANLRKATCLLGDIERTEATIGAYRGADSITAFLPENATHNSGHHRVELSAAEIGDAVVDALQRRLAKMRVELGEFGVEDGTACDTGRH
jgi:hypothetical protein